KSPKEIRTTINDIDERLDKNYDKHNYHDLDYVRFALYALEIENETLKDEILEQEVAGTNLGINMKKWEEYGLINLEQGIIHLGKKILFLKSGLVQQSRILIIIGLMMVVIRLDNPKSYVCRVSRDDILEVPDTEEKFPEVLEMLAAVLNLKKQQDAVGKKKELVAKSRPLKELSVEFSNLNRKYNAVIASSRSFNTFNTHQKPRFFNPYGRFRSMPVKLSSKSTTLSSIFNKTNDVSKSTYHYPHLTKDQEALSSRTPQGGIIDKFNLTVINFYGKLIVERSTNNDDLPSVFVYSTQFMTKYLNSGYQGVSKWTKKVDIFSKDLLFVPIHSGAHWSLCLVDFQAFRIDYIDSMYGGGTAKGMDEVKEYLINECQNKKGENANLDFNSWAENPRLKKVPQQKNSYDCGVFTLAFIEHISRQAPLLFNQSLLPYFRKKIIYEIAS
ncbi:12478_t:CDS:10, partial [Entrophospora sp. SA101]